MNLVKKEWYFLKNNKIPYLLSMITLIIGAVLMTYLRRVYFIGIIIAFIIVVFQTPSTKVDRTGEINDANISMLRVVGLHALMFVAGGYISLIFF